MTPLNIQDQLNRLAPAAAHARLGNILNDIITGLNAILAVMDSTGAQINASDTVTVGGAVTVNDTLSLTFTNPQVASMTAGVTVTVAMVAGDTTTTAATKLAAAINANTILAAANVTATSAAAVVTVHQPGLVGNSTVVTHATTGGNTETLTTATGNLTGGLGTVGNTNSTVLHVRTLVERATTLL